MTAEAPVSVAEAADVIGIPEYSEEALALYVAQEQAGRLAYVTSLNRWFSNAGHKWVEDEYLEIIDRIRNVVRTRAAWINEVRVDLSEQKRERAAAYVASSRTVAGVERLARADRELVRPLSMFDRDPWVLNTPTGVLDLRSGEVRPRGRLEYFTKCTAVDVGEPSCPLWWKTLERITGGDDELQDFLQRFFGYCLTGVTTEHVFTFMFGSGGNGKSVVINTMAGILGDYAVTTPADLFLESKNDRHPTELAMLRGARIAVSAELDDRRRWNASRIKSLTGGDAVSARFMRGDFFTFENTAKLLVAGNHRPSLASVDEGIRRRLLLVPFEVRIPEEERDKDLFEKLRDEWPDILAWAVQGCLDWLDRGGLKPPACVSDASASYLENQDVLGQWIADCIESDSVSIVGSKELHASYQTWATERGERFMGEKTLSQTMEDRGYRRIRTNAVRGFVGVRLRDRLL